MRISVVHPCDLGESEIAIWRELQDAHPALDNPFLSPEFIIEVGRLRPQARVAVISDATGILGFFPFERHPFGIGMPIAAGLTDAQGLVHCKDAEFDPHTPQPSTWTSTSPGPGSGSGTSSSRRSPGPWKRSALTG